MKKIIIFIALVSFYVYAKSGSIVVDAAFAKAVYLEGKSKNAEKSEYLDDLDFERPLAGEIVDGNGRLFHFIGFFKNNSIASGYYAVFEICKGSESEYFFSFSGFSPDIEKEFLEFKSAENDKNADFPGECKTEEG